MREAYNYKSVLDMLNYVKARNMIVTLDTNGFNLADIAEDLVRIEVDKLVVSIDVSEAEL